MYWAVLGMILYLVRLYRVMAMCISCHLANIGLLSRYVHYLTFSPGTLTSYGFYSMLDVTASTDANYLSTVFLVLPCSSPPLFLLLHHLYFLHHLLSPFL
ncbi:hypothetical protein BCR39DRAFT_29422 [Naematelia encephala]|uniref:Uncharacterized protein n=1 Tax=Naematelia encephala TaxID=71784 RepID=A0A1Y2BLR4_9TREE|nr:hypothetical protein BCR39DRAFT_29422 [Naematelia encephala]